MKMDSNEDLMWCRLMMKTLDGVDQIKKKRFKVYMDNKAIGLCDGSWNPPILVEGAPLEDIMRISAVETTPPPAPPAASTSGYAGPSTPRQQPIIYTLQPQTPSPLHGYISGVPLQPVQQVGQSAAQPGGKVYAQLNTVPLHFASNQ